MPTDINTIPKLKQALINLNLSPHLVLICYYPHPAPELVRAISNIEHVQRIQRIWLSDDEIDGALQPDRENLAGVIQDAAAKVAETETKTTKPKRVNCWTRLKMAILL